MNTSNKLYINPHGGLCNMIRTVLGAKRLSLILDVELCIYWGYTIPGSRRNKEIPLEFNDIFDNDLCIVKSLPNDAVYYKYSDKPNSLIGSVDIPIVSGMIKINSVCIDSCGLGFDYSPYDIPIVDYSMFIFKEEYFRIVSDLITDESTIGVHIRRGDFVIHSSEKLYPVSWYADCIQNEIDNDADVKVFLATDDSNVENELVGVFGSRIIVYKKTEYHRDSIDFVKSGIIDLLALSRCMKIYGSYYSSYSETAANIGQIPLILK